MKTETPHSPFRRKARQIILQTIEDNVMGPVQLLPHGDVLELRQKLREAYPWPEFKLWPYKVWCQEVRAALGYAPTISRRKAKPRLRTARQVMPAMREWAASSGLIAEPGTAPTAEPAEPFQLQP